jgi:hypothetical protein
MCILNNFSKSINSLTRMNRMEIDTNKHSDSGRSSSLLKSCDHGTAQSRPSSTNSSPYRNRHWGPAASRTFHGTWPEDLKPTRCCPWQSHSPKTSLCGHLKPVYLSKIAGMRKTSYCPSMSSLYRGGLERKPSDTHHSRRRACPECVHATDGQSVFGRDEQARVETLFHWFRFLCVCAWRTTWSA